MKLFLAAFLVFVPMTVFAESKAAPKAQAPAKQRFALAQTNTASASLSADVSSTPALDTARLYVGFAIPAPHDQMGPEISALWRLSGTSNYLGFTVSGLFDSGAFLVPLMLTYQYRVETLGMFHPYFGLSVGAAIGGDSASTGFAFATSPRIGFEFALSETVSFYAEPKFTLYVGRSAGLTFNPMAGFAFGL